MKILINSERRNIPLTTHHPRDQEYCQHQTREAFLPQSGVLSINIYWDILEREQGEERERERGQCLDNYVECGVLCG